MYSCGNDMSVSLVVARNKHTGSHNIGAVIEGAAETPKVVPSPTEHMPKLNRQTVIRQRGSLQGLFQRARLIARSWSTVEKTEHDTC